jgi:hypothetical protein
MHTQAHAEYGGAHDYGALEMRPHLRLYRALIAAGKGPRAAMRLVAGAYALSPVQQAAVVAAAGKGARQ